MKEIFWYMERLIKYYILRPEYRKVYGGFSSYCEYRRNYESKGRGRKKE